MVTVAEWSNASDCDSDIRKDFAGSNPVFHPLRNRKVSEKLMRK